MKILLSSIFSIFLLSIFFSNKVTALTTELVSENEAEKVYSILSVAPKESSAVQIRVTVTGGIISNVEPGDPEKLSYISVCENEESFQDNIICMDIASITGLLEENQVLAQVTVTANPGEEVIFSTNETHAYLTTDRELMTEESVVLEKYEVTEIEEEPAPIVEEAKINDKNSLPFVLLIGILVILVGAFLVIILFSGKDSKNIIN